MLIWLLSIIILACGYGSYKITANQEKETNAKEATNKEFAEKNFKVKIEEELGTQDFETAYEFGKAFLSDYYSQRSGTSIIDFSKYIVNENLLKYSNKRILVDNHVMDIKEIAIGLDKAQFIGDEKSYYFAYTIVTKDSNVGGFGEVVEILISNFNGTLVISDWYIRYGTGSSSFDEKLRPNEVINSPKVWESEEYVKSIFGKAGLN
jgi:hypothetical protein